MKKKKLGKGLDALLGNVLKKTPVETAVSVEEVAEAFAAAPGITAHDKRPKDGQLV